MADANVVSGMVDEIRARSESFNSDRPQSGECFKRFGQSI